MRRQLLFILLVLLIMHCSKEFPSELKPNDPPHTYISLFPEGALRTGSSQQHIHWWGTDSDGLVVGFLLSVDSSRWIWTTKNDSIFSLTLFRQDTTYSFYVAAVDNQGNGIYDSNTPYGPEPFVDLNGNGRWDPGESFVDWGAIDPTPANLRFPIQNTPPKVTFVLNTDVPETTFTVASFSWAGTDVDGDETIQNYWWALDDTSNPNRWHALPGTSNFLTLGKADGITQGNHAFYLKAQDIAGAFSNIARMPDTSRVWFVNEPKGPFLVMDDYGTADNSASFYASLFDTLAGGKFKNSDVWDIKKGATATRRGIFVPALINPTFLETLKLFKYVFWYSDNQPSLEIAQRVLPEYKKNGGKVFFSAAFPENAGGTQGSLVDFTPIDSISPGFINFIPSKTAVFPDSQYGRTYPTLVRDDDYVPVVFIRWFKPKIDARPMYYLGSSAFWSGNPIIGVKDADQPSFVLLGLPLHRFNGGGKMVGECIRRVFAELGY